MGFFDWFSGMFTTRPPEPPLPSIGFTCGKDTKADFESQKITIELRYENGIFRLTPDRFLLSELLKQVDVKKNFYIPTKVDFIGFGNDHNIFNVHVKIGFHYFDKNPDQIGDIITFTLPEDSNGSIQRNLWKHQWPDKSKQSQMEFYSFPTYKDQILEPRYSLLRTDDDLPGKLSYCTISVASPFYKAYYESFESFKKYLLQGGKGKNIDPNIYLIIQKDNKVDPKSVKISLEAINAFVEYAYQNVYSLLEFIDFQTSYIEFEIKQTIVNQNDTGKFTKALNTRYRGNIPDHPVVPVSVDIRFTYLSIPKQYDPKGQDQVENITFGKESTLWNVGNPRVISTKAKIMQNIVLTKVVPPSDDQPNKETNMIVEKLN